MSFAKNESFLLPIVTCPALFNDVVDSAVGAPRHTRGKSLWQQLQERAH